jgi:hypothetical protein
MSQSSAALLKCYTARDADTPPRAYIYQPLCRPTLHVESGWYSCALEYLAGGMVSPTEGPAVAAGPNKTLARGTGFESTKAIIHNLPKLWILTTPLSGASACSCLGSYLYTCCNQHRHQFPEVPKRFYLCRQPSHFENPKDLRTSPPSACIVSLECIKPPQ